MPAFVDAEALLADYLETATSIRTGTALPEKLEEALPICRVTGIGGTDDRITDRVRVTVESFAALRTDAHDQAEAARMLMLALAHTQLRDAGGSGWVIDTVETLSRPTWIDYANDHVQRFIATYELTSRVRVS